MIHGTNMARVRICTFLHFNLQLGPRRADADARRRRRVTAAARTAAARTAADG